MDEPKSIAGLTLAAREGLENLTFINEAGASASWIAAATSYSVNRKALPFSIYYSMFEL